MSDATPTMTHEEASLELAGAALDALPARERERVLAHAAECARCGPELRALARTAAALAEAFDPAGTRPFEQARKEAVRERLMARIAREREAEAEARPVAASDVAPALRVERGGAAGGPQGTPRRRWAFATPARVALAAGIAFVAAAVGLGRTAAERDRLREQLGAATAARSQADAERRRLAATLDERDRLIAALTGPKVRVVNLAAAGDRAPSARMFWDQAANAWTFVAHDLPAPATGRTYQLWVIARQAGVTSYVSAGTFAPGPNGSAVVRATYPLAPNALSAIGVTDEPAGGVPQPTGRLVLVGNAE